ncbi:TMEM165/GDT1 family protein [Cyanobacterium stanieri LEGE 03274]|uniref:GDT1 family protein n=1 Tax=Cyanobacterium stanieri LEGE 03274 TaxID=1828756 RepID=A0ABR9V553_9CHRO|nr:TMEM165/GDT1 family protein [Cyanobacterium stanieri]MBE9223020.1 TMEM165/GDT1 family protein [Cyanobacterium stanieri LEGE 03274]
MSVELEREIKEIETLAEAKNIKKWSFWGVFSSTFLTILFAEMGDKTQLATLLLSAQSNSPWIVFLGAALALVATSLVGVLLGYWLSKRLTPKILDLSLSILLLLVAGGLIMDVLDF